MTWTGPAAATRGAEGTGGEGRRITDDVKRLPKAQLTSAPIRTQSVSEGMAMGMDMGRLGKPDCITEGMAMALRAPDISNVPRCPRVESTVVCIMYATQRRPHSWRHGQSY
jgi:hypothetical protein